MKPPENREGPATRAKVTGPEISSANQIVPDDTTSDDAVRCIRCSRELTAERSIRHEAGRRCRHLLAQGVAA